MPFANLWNPTNKPIKGLIAIQEFAKFREALRESSEGALSNSHENNDLCLVRLLHSLMSRKLRREETS